MLNGDPGYWPLIRPEWSRDQDAGLWLADVEETRTQVGIFLENIDIVELIQLGDLLVQAYFAPSLMHPQNNGVWLIMIDHVTWTLASDWLRVITWPEYWPLIGQERPSTPERKLSVIVAWDNGGFSEYFNTFIHCARLPVYISPSSITAGIIVQSRIWK